LNIETKNLGNCEVQLTIEVPEDRVQAAMRSAAQRLGKQTKISGFRPGKAPYKIIVQHLGEETIFEESLETLAQEVYREAIDEVDLSRDPLIMRFTVPLAPKVNLGDYRKLRLPYDHPEIKDESMEEFLEELRSSQAIIELVDRPVEKSDVAILDINGRLIDKPEEKEPELIDEKGIPVFVADSTKWPVPDMMQHLIGLEADQETSFDHTFPDDYSNEDLQGRKASFTIKCLEVKSRSLPEWSDDLARDLGDFEDLADLREKARQDLQARAEENAKAAYAIKVVDKAVEGSTIEYPPVLLDEEIKDMLRDLDQRLKMQNLSLADYLKIEQKSQEDLKSEIEPRAREQLKRSLMLGEVVKAGELQVSEEEVDTEVESALSSFPEPTEKIRQLFNHPIQRRRITNDKLTQKAIQRLILIARGELKEAETKDAGKKTRKQMKTVETAEAGQTERTPAVEAVESGQTEPVLTDGTIEGNDAEIASGESAISGNASEDGIGKKTV
jgi:trigger factor